MSLLDLFRKKPAVTAAPSPRKHAHQRHQPRRRDYEKGGAQTTRLTADWTAQPQTPDQMIRRNLRVLRARSREQVANDPYARRFRGMLCSNVIGSQGIVLQGRVRDPDGSLDGLANTAIETAWREWGRAEFCDMGGRLSWQRAQELFISTVAIDGECPVRMVTGPEAGRFGFALQFLDPELIDTAYDVERRGGVYVRLGIECDSWDRPVAYHFLDPTIQNHGYYYSSGYAGGKRIRVAAADLIHGYVVEVIGQRRGLPWMSTALLKLKMLSGYEDAALMAARSGACTQGFISSPTGDGYVGTDLENDDGSGSKIRDMEPLTIEELPEGQTFTSFDPTYPHEQFPTFCQQMLRSIASALMVSYHGLSNDLTGVNYSSIRAGRLDELDVWKLLQTWCAETFHSRVYRAWLPMALMSGQIKLPNGSALPLERVEKFESVSWQGRRWQWVDPLKEVQAGREAVDARIQSPQDLIREQGRDPEEVLEEIASFFKRARELEVPVIPKTTGAVQANPEGAMTDE
jgi:lambda family phage portal protein